MFRIKYGLTIGDFSFLGKYPSDKKQEDGNIFVIRGPNESGKSTILQIIALGLKANRLPNIKENLKNKIDRLISEDATLWFNFEIADKQHKIKISSKKEKNAPPNDIKLEVNGVAKSLENFKSDFHIIFDVPDDPYLKLREAIGSVKDIFQQYDDALGRTIEYLGEVIAEIKAYQNADKYKKEIAQELKMDLEELEKLRREKQQIENEFLKLEETYICNKYEFLENKIYEKTAKLKKIKGKLRKLSLVDTTRKNSKLNELINDFNEKLVILQKELESIERAAKIFDKAKKNVFMSVLDTVNSIETYNTIKLAEYTNLIEKIRSLISFLEKNPYLKEKMPEEEPYEVYVRLIKILEPFCDKKIIIPGTNLYIKQFLLELRKQIDTLKIKLSKKHEVEAAINKLQTAKELIRELKEKAIEINKLGESVSSTNAKALETFKKSLEIELDKYYAELAKIKDKYDRIDEKIKEDPNRALKDMAELEQEYLSMKEDLNDIKQKIEKITHACKMRERDLKKLSVHDSPPKYFKKLKKLEEYKIKLLKVRKKINDAKNLLNELSKIEKNFKNKKLSDWEKRFYEGLSKYLANILERLCYLGKWYNLNKVDVINSQFIVDGTRSPIKFKNLSTGRSQTTSLLTQLRQDVGNKRKIVLFDEIQVMDKNSLKIVLDELKAQAKAGQLILAIIARVDDSIKELVMEKIW